MTKKQTDNTNYSENDRLYFWEQCVMKCLPQLHIFDNIDNTLKLIDQLVLVREDKIRNHAFSDENMTTALDAIRTQKAPSQQ